MRSALRLLAALLLAGFAATALAQGSLLVPKDLEERLRLTPEQKAQFDRSASASQTALFSIGLVALQMKTRIATELRKDAPDFEGLLRELDDVGPLVRPHFELARREWAAFYAMLSAEQAALAREEIDRRLGMLERGAAELARSLRDKLEKAR